MTGYNYWWQSVRRRSGRSTSGHWHRSLVFAFLAFEIIGLNMFASVNWDPIQFVRQLPWLALEPPGPQWGFTLFVPLAEVAGGRWRASSCPPHCCCGGCGPIAAPARSDGHARRWAFGRAILLILTLGFIRPMLMGSWARRCRSASSRTSTGPRRFRPLRKPVLQPLPRFSIVFLYGSTMLFAMHGATILAVGRYGGSARSRDRRSRHRHERAALFWRWTMGFNATMESIHRWAWWFAVLTP